MGKFDRKKLVAMLTGLAALTFGGSAIAGATIATNFDGCTPKRTIFFAYHATHDKAVEVCKVKGGYRYTNGSLNNPVFSFVQHGNGARRIPTDPGNGFLMHNGTYNYWLSQDVYGNKYLMATRHQPYNKQKPLSKIPLDSQGWGYTNNSYKLPE